MDLYFIQSSFRFTNCSFCWLYQVLIKLTIHILQVLNLTEIELNRVDIRVGLSGGLYFMDGSPQAVRQLRDLTSQVKMG